MRSPPSSEQQGFEWFECRLTASALSSSPSLCGGTLYEIAVIHQGMEVACRAECRLDGSGRGLDFLRGDTNNDGKISLSDPIHLMQFIVRGRPVACLDAGDFDDSGLLDVTDAVLMLTFLFLDGAVPPPPFPTPGPDPTEDEVCCS